MKLIIVVCVMVLALVQAEGTFRTIEKNWEILSFHCYCLARKVPRKDDGNIYELLNKSNKSILIVQVAVTNKNETV